MKVYTEAGKADHPPVSGSRQAAGAPSALVQATPALASRRATVRTYRHGSGDGHLVTLAGEGGRTCRILIDGGGAPATPDASTVRDAIVDDILEQTGGHVDLLIATQTGAGHLPGLFGSAQALAKLDVGEVWLAWTEDPADPEARALHAERARALDKLRLAAAEVQLRGTADEARAIGSLLAFYGIAGRAFKGDEVAALRATTALPIYCRPGDGPRELPGVGARIYLFGAPSGGEGRSVRGDSRAELALDEFVFNVMPNLEGQAVDNPFSTLYAIPEPVARSLPFFQEHYWEDAPWRRIDTAWITDATQFGLVLDSLTNSASLGLAIELDGGDVLLFASGVQPGAGLLAGQPGWSAGGRKVNGRDLLARTVFYKTGHHGGRDAALEQDALRLMPRLRSAIIPVYQAAALPPDGDDVPIAALQQALAEGIGDRGYVLRTDQDPPAAALDHGVTATPGWFDVHL